MTEDNPWMKHLEWLKKVIENLICQRGKAGGQLMIPKVIFHNIVGRFKHITRGTRQSPNPVAIAASSSAQDVPPNCITRVKQPDPKSVNDRNSNATKDVIGMTGIFQNVASVAGHLQSDSVSNSNMSKMVSELLPKLKLFNSLANGLADVHPHVKVALNILTCVSKISEVYTLIMTEKEVAKIETMLEIYDALTNQGLIIEKLWLGVDVKAHMRQPLVFGWLRTNISLTEVMLKLE
ncbi:hypothetical protein DEU56DRAFT_750210 [Suillus clintonianus]|uniref:uncharacterized protein n=1 Tax=Suillus clintonianus TaxID=1904413 RepID=UPI001B86BD43|nr:uncharacterized protein DEU56DRAFT_750210 [Suillus clintonianus]KAG2156990.1 hypothetical protein DEU56DRAFT_750210 [Suillus clintonianus]